MLKINSVQEFFNNKKLISLLLELNGENPKTIFYDIWENKLLPRHIESMESLIEFSPLFKSDWENYWVKICKRDENWKLKNHYVDIGKIKDRVMNVMDIKKKRLFFFEAYNKFYKKRNCREYLSTYDYRIVYFDNGWHIRFTINDATDNLRIYQRYNIDKRGRYVRRWKG